MAVTKAQLSSAKRKVDRAKQQYEQARGARNVLVRQAMAEGAMRQSEVARLAGVSAGGVAKIRKQRSRA